MADRTTDINNGSKVKFLLGTQAALEPYIAGTKTAVNGTFYLTNDSHRLYVGNKDGKAVPVNEGVVTVANLTALQTNYATAHPGEFFYVTDGNILCVCAGLDSTGQKKFVQINNNTNTYVESAKTTISATGSVATVSEAFTRNDGVDVENSFQIATAEGIKVSVSEDKKTLTLTGTTNSNFAFTVTSANGKATAKLTLTDSNGDTTEASIKSASTDLLNLSKDTDGSLLFTPKDQKVKAVKATAGATGFSVAITNHDGVDVSGTIDPKIKIGANAATQKTVSFNNGIASLDVYTKAEIDSLAMAMNAMTYKGLVKSDSNTSTSAKKWSEVVNGTTTKVSIGDTYLFLDDITFSQTGATEKSETYTAGTLAIAKTSTGGEDANGYLTGIIDWDYVESTKDTDTTYEYTINGKTVQLQEHVGSVTNTAGSIEFANGTATTASVTGSGNAAKVVFNHANVTHTSSNGDAVSQGAAAITQSNTASTQTTVTVLEGITVNNQGHVTDVKSKEITLTDTNATINAFDNSLAVANNTATFTNGLQLTHGNGVTGTKKTASFKVTSNNLTLTKSGDALSIDLVWGTF